MNSQGNNKCVYCDGNCEKSEANLNMVMYYLPFNKSIDDAIRDYKKKIRFKVFVPFAFRKRSKIKSIRKVYVPILIRSVKVNGKISFFGADGEKKGKEEQLKKYEVGYDINLDFDNILISLYSKIDDKIEKIVDSNENYNNLSLFNDSILSDSSCIISDYDENGIDNKINNIVSKCSIGMVRDSIKHDLKKLKENNLVVQNSSEQRILLPVYFLNVKLKDQDHFYLMNAYNGNSYIELSISKVSIIIFSIVIFGLIFAIVFLIAGII